MFVGPNEVILLTELVKLGTAILELAKRPDTDRAKAAHVRRLAYDTSLEIRRRLRNAAGNQ